jgi:hypothetical protein
MKNWIHAAMVAAFRETRKVDLVAALRTAE